MKNLYKLTIVLLMFALLLSACAQQEPENLLEKIKADGKITVGTSADYPPFESVDENGEIVGFDIDIMKEIGKRLEVEVEMVDMGFDGLVTAVQEGKLQAVIAAMAPTPERQEKVDFTIPYFYGLQTILGAPDTDISITDPKQMADYKVGIQSGTTMEEYLLTELVESGLMSEDNIARYERVDNAALDLKAGRIDLVFTDTGPALDFVDSMGVKELFTDSIVKAGGSAIAMPKGETELQQAMNDIIQQMIDEGLIDQYRDQWGAQ